jgi:hypothetical protein
VNELPSEFRDHPPVSAKTLGTIRQRLVARLAPEILNPFDRRRARGHAPGGDGAILEDPELDLAATPPMIAPSRRRCGLGRLQPLVEDVEVSDILVNAPTRSSPSGRAARGDRGHLGSADESSRSPSGSRPSRDASCRSRTRSSTPGCPTARE